MDKVYIVSYRPPWEERYSIYKAFIDESDAQEFIEEDKKRVKKLVGDNGWMNGWIGDYEIDEIELIN